VLEISGLQSHRASNQYESEGMLMV